MKKKYEYENGFIILDEILKFTDDIVFLAETKTN